MITTPLCAGIAHRVHLGLVHEKGPWDCQRLRRLRRGQGLILRRCYLRLVGLREWVLLVGEWGLRMWEGMVGLL